MDFATLRDELALPAYQGLTDQQAADLLNAEIQVPRATVPAYEVWEAIVPSEWSTLVAVEKQRVQTMLSMGTLTVQGANTRAAFLAAFGAGTTTRSNLAALQTESGTRAGQIGWGPVTARHVQIARGGEW